MCPLRGPESWPILRLFALDLTSILQILQHPQLGFSRKVNVSGLLPSSFLEVRDSFLQSHPLHSWSSERESMCTGIIYHSMCVKIRGQFGVLAFTFYFVSDRTTYHLLAALPVSIISPFYLVVKNAGIINMLLCLSFQRF